MRKDNARLRPAIPSSAPRLRTDPNGEPRPGGLRQTYDHKRTIH